MRFFLAVGALLCGLPALAAVSVNHERGTLTLEQIPTRIIALEYSFVDALGNVGVSPLGVADDNDPKRILPEVRAMVGEWTSLGARSQPNMETMASLKPDLIIADKDRHSAAYEEMSKIAPVLLLNSRYGTFEQSLEQAQTIGDVVGKSEEMRDKIQRLRQALKQSKEALPQGQKAFLGGSREDGFSLHARESYTGTLLMEMGFEVPPAPAGSKAIYEASLEQLLALNPDWIFIAHYREESITKKWASEALWQAIAAVQKQQTREVDANLWARGRGLTAARLMADEIRALVLKP